MMLYSAKTVFRIERRDGTGVSALEERVVLLNAKDAEDAIRQAEEGALAYEADLVWTNFEGLEIKGRYLKTCDVFELTDEVVSGAELYSTTMLLREKLPDTEVVDRLFGPARDDDVDELLGGLEPDFEAAAGEKET